MASLGGKQKSHDKFDGRLFLNAGKKIHYAITLLNHAKEKELEDRHYPDLEEEIGVNVSGRSQSACQARSQHTILVAVIESRLIGVTVGSSRWVEVRINVNGSFRVKVKDTYDERRDSELDPVVTRGPSCTYGRDTRMRMIAKKEGIHVEKYNSRQVTHGDTVESPTKR
ncbi:hypothetical protein EVAR_84660_1 [Eumeta japonica]|uniref:Uncharacterized protein n=1 Tax=Eumeta variegata TaxID=151549 RepID=A0A4C1UYL2_EUMVA|nr:hypothetical protein EVAR_84660_1 [Eumeta japonica]